MTAEIYLNNSSHGRPVADVIERCIAHLRLEAEIGPDRAAAQVSDELALVRTSAATLLGADEARIGLSSTTCATWLDIVSRLALAGKRVLVAPHEWFDNLSALRALGAGQSFQVEVLPDLDFAAPDLDAWAARIDSDVAAICLPMVTSVSGHRYPVEAIGRLDRPKGCHLIIDAAQAVGQMPIDMASLNCDLFVATTRKWVRAPRQTAVFWMSEGMEGRDGLLDPHALEPFDSNVAVRLGMGLALQQVLDRGAGRLQADLGLLSSHIREQATRHQISCMNEPSGGSTAVTVALPADRRPAIEAGLAAAACQVKWPDARLNEPHSPEARSSLALMRISPHLDSTTSDIDRVFSEIAQN